MGFLEKHWPIMGRVANWNPADARKKKGKAVEKAQGQGLRGLIAFA
jgi:hypothetical protein